MHCYAKEPTKNNKVSIYKFKKRAHFPQKYKSFRCYTCVNNGPYGEVPARTLLL